MSPVRVIFFAIIMVTNAQAPCDPATCSQCLQSSCISCLSPYLLVDGQCLILQSISIIQSFDGIGGQTTRFQSNSGSQSGSTNQNQGRQEGDAENQETVIVISNVILQGCAYQKGDQCMICSEGFLLTASLFCVPYIQKCLSIDFETSVCKECIGSLQLTEAGQCQDLKCASGRWNYYQCQQCLQGFNKNQGGICIHPHCDIYDNGQCIQCISGYSLIPNNFIYYCVSQASNIQNCLIPQQVRPGNWTCRKCMNGYSPSEENDRCISVCEVFQSQGGKCLNCSASLFLLEDGSCASSSIIPYIDSCQSYSSQIACLECRSGYVLDSNNNRCFMIIDKCRQYAGDGKCSQCEQGYSLTASGLCASRRNCVYVNQNNECEQCLSGYSLSQFKCSLSDPFCVSYSAEEVCLDCIEGFILIEGSCSLFVKIAACEFFENQSCTECPEDYFLNSQSGLCLREIQKCTQYSPYEGSCLGCEDGYLLINQICVLEDSAEPYLPANCRVVDTVNQVCIQCIERFYRDANNRCMPVSSYCDFYDYTNGNCISCRPGARLVGETCLPVSPSTNITTITRLSNCQVPDPANPQICQKCIERFYVKEGVCRGVDARCNRYRSADGSCIDCVIGFLMIDGQCKQPPFGHDKRCVEWSSKAYCLQCQNGYRLIEYVCSPL